MSDTRSRPGDWSEQSEALFQSARGDHAPSALDRARVRSALAKRLATASNLAPAGGTLPGPGASRAALGKLVKIGVGVACVMAGTFAIMRDHESRKPAARAPAELQPTAAAANRSEPAPAPALSTPTVATTGHEPAVVAALTRPQSAATARAVITKRSRARSTPPKLSAAARAPAQAERQHEAEQVTPREPPAPASDTSAVAQEAVSEPAPKQLVAAQPKPAHLPAATERSDSADERAELAFVARINAALRASKLHSVLALCAEHERRWPLGAFVQEREALHAIASCGSGVIDAAARAQTFLASYPRAPLAARVRAACRPQQR